MRTGVSLSRGTIAPHRHAQIVSIHFQHQPRTHKNSSLARISSQKRNRSTKYFAVFATYRRRGRFERRLVVGSAISARDAVPTIRLERFVQTLYNSKVSESVEELLELC